MFRAISPIIRSVDLYYSMWCSAPSFVVFLCGYSGRLLRGPCVCCGGHCSSCALAVRLSRKVTAWSVCMVWRALLELCPCRAAIQEGCCVVRVYGVAGTARVVPLPCGYPGRLLRGPCVRVYTDTRVQNTTGCNTGLRSWWWAKSPETCRAKRTPIKLLCCI
jgi:hypothetical protein